MLPLCELQWLWHDSASTIYSPTKLPQGESNTKTQSVPYQVVYYLSSTHPVIFMKPTSLASPARRSPGQTLPHTQSQTLGTAEEEKPSWLLPAGNALVNRSGYSGSCSLSLSPPTPRRQQSFSPPGLYVYVKYNVPNLIDKGVRKEKKRYFLSTERRRSADQLQAASTSKQQAQVPRLHEIVPCSER